MELKVKKLHVDAKLPERANSTDAGVDIFTIEAAELRPGEVVTLRTGIAVQIVGEPGKTYVGHVWDKSGIGAKGIKTLGGVIDHAYTGEVKVTLVNTNGMLLWINLIQMLLNNTASREIGRLLQSTLKPYIIQKGQKVAQLIVQTVELPAVVEELGEFAETERGDKGFGSTGLGDAGAIRITKD